MSESPRLAPLDRSAVPELESVFAKFEKKTGVLPNNLLVMARRPALVEARRAMAEANWERKVPAELADLVFLMASMVSGCRYCQAHRTTAMSDRGMQDEKLEAIWEFESSPLFSNAERAALRLARDSAATPNAVTDEHFVELRQFFDEGEIVDLVASSCAAAWSNRWNDTMATALESHPLESMARLKPDWQPGKHGPTN